MRGSEEAHPCAHVVGGLSNRVPVKKGDGGREREREGESERRVAVKVQVDGRTAREGEVGKGYYHATVCLYRLAF